MDNPSPQLIGGDGSIRPQIGGDTEIRQEQIFYEPVSSSRRTVQASEKKLTLFALQIVTLEKIANGFRTLVLLWATAVLLGGYAIILSRTDFWFITVIISSEGVLILTGRNGIQFPQQSSWTIASAIVHCFNRLKWISACKDLKLPVQKSTETTSRDQSASTSKWESAIKESSGETSRDQSTLTRTWESSEVPLLPYGGWFLLSRNIGKSVYCMQLSSTIACMSLSIIRLVRLSHANAIEPSAESKNERYALILFYGSSLAQAFTSLLQKIYWEWMIGHRKLLEEVNNECEFGRYGIIPIQRFFYAAYSACLSGSIFDGLKLDLVSFAKKLLASDSNDELVIGTQILLHFSTNPEFSDETLKRIVKSISVIERLVEMLNWTNPEDAEIRLAAAVIVSKLAGKKHNALRVAGIPGAIESISSLLYTQHSSISAFFGDLAMYDFFPYIRIGLIILKKLARNQDNSEKIGNMRGLLPKIIDFTHAEEILLTDRDADTSTLKRSLQVLKSLAGTSGIVGKHLRQEIVENVSTVRNIREILMYGQKHPKLQLLGIQILTSLALDVEARERIGSTGGVVKELLQIFFKGQISDNETYETDVIFAAGEAIAMLALHSERNCSRILKYQVLTKLMWALEDPLLSINSAQILRYLCKFSGEDCSVNLLGVAAAAAPTVLKAIMSENNKLQEVMLGLATQLFRFMTPKEARIIFKQTGIEDTELAMKILQILQIYRNPSSEVPRMRRFAIELAILMMKSIKAMARTFKDLGIVEELEILGETTSEIESFDIFDGTVGLSRHSTSMHILVENTLELLAEE